MLKIRFSNKIKFQNIKQVQSLRLSSLIPSRVERPGILSAGGHTRTWIYRGPPWKETHPCRGTQRSPHRPFIQGADLTSLSQAGPEWNSWPAPPAELSRRSGSWRAFRCSFTPRWSSSHAWDREQCRCSDSRPSIGRQFYQLWSSSE